MQKINLVIIDPQNDFCNPKGTLFVPGAEEDVQRLTDFIKRIGNSLNDISVTLDSHHIFDVGHPIYWKDSSGNNPDPFTIISADEIKSGRWTTTIPSLYKYSLDYARQLEANGKYPLIIWPYHCLIGSWGTSVVPELHSVLQEWEIRNVAMVNYVTKGSNYKTEHYSGIKADVPDPNDPSTQLNTNFVTDLEQVDQIVIAGEASSHCVKETVCDIVNNFSNEDYAKKVTLLTDAMSAVPTFEQFEKDFFDFAKQKGINFSTTEEFLSSVTGEELCRV